MHRKLRLEMELGPSCEWWCAMPKSWDTVLQNVGVHRELQVSLTQKTLCGSSIRNSDAFLMRCLQGSCTTRIFCLGSLNDLFLISQTFKYA